MQLRKVIPIILFLFWSTVVFSQSQQGEKNTHEKYVGFSVQLYPAGVITTVNSELFFNQNSAIILRAGGNFADRTDLSPYNDNEWGKGIGGSIGYRRHFPLKTGSLLAGINLDVWNMWINWKDDVNGTNPTAGQTYTLVVQPWLEFGYFLNIKKSPFQVGFTGGFGREINVITNGEEVGQGWMGSVLFYFQYRIGK